MRFGDQVLSHVCLIFLENRRFLLQRSRSTGSSWLQTAAEQNLNNDANATDRLAHTETTTPPSSSTILTCIFLYPEDNIRLLQNTFHVRGPTNTNTPYSDLEAEITIYQ